MKIEIRDSDVKMMEDVLKTQLKCRIQKVERMGGLTNRTYHVVLDNGEEVVFRIPGEGTEEMISRSDEKISTELACRIGIDSELLYFGEDGIKICRYINNAVTMNGEKLREWDKIKEVARIFKKLHSSDVDTGVPFEVFDMASNYENIISKNKVSLYEDYSAVKQAVMKIKKQNDANGSGKKVPCHNDSLCENWVYGTDRMYLIDWEYAGMNDPMWDLADVSIEAEYGENEDKYLLEEYWGREVALEEKKKFIANKIYLDYLWTLWGLTRVPFDGDEMQSYADLRYIRLKDNIKKYHCESK